MKKKHTYRSKNVKSVKWATLKEQIAGEKVVFAIDVAKEKQFALLSTADGVGELIHWRHPEETREVLEGLKSLECVVEVVLESTGSYGDALRYQFRSLGFEIYQASAKRVFDAREVYDGVPSLHDAKAATLITRHHRDGLTRPWRESDGRERELDALRREFDLHQSQRRRNQNRLEGLLARHWPEMLALLPLDSVTLESLLIAYGSPESLFADAQAAERLRALSKGMIAAEKAARIVQSAGETLGVPCLDSERRLLKALGEELRHSRLQQQRAKSALEASILADDGLKHMRALIGLVTTAIFVSCRLDPRQYGHARSFMKALGLNLKEKSSGTHQGPLRITKRGCSIARAYLYYAALRLIRSDPVVKAWFEQKADPKAKNKTVIALMRKLAKALWHVARGERFDAARLFAAA